MNSGTTTNESTREARADLRDLLISMETALMGLEATPEGGCPPHPGAMSAFGPGSHRRAVDVAPGLWAVLRTSPDGAGQVLCMHNPGDDPIEFVADGHFDEALPGPSYFLRGTVTSGGTHSAVTCRLGAREFVWLGRFTEQAVS